MNRILSTAALAGIAVALSASNFSALTAVLEQNTRTVEWARVNRITIAQKSSRKIRLSGPWMDYISSVNGSGGISGRNIAHADGKTTLILDATATAGRGDKEISAAISCPFGSGLIGCKDIVAIPMRVFESGPINSIFPNGTVPANTPVTFDLTGEGFDVAALLPRLLSLKNASIQQFTSTTIRVRGTTPACGFVDVALTDEDDGDEFPYRKGPNLQSVLAGHICGTSLAPNKIGTQIICPTGTNWNDATKSCQ
jgi:hypothetical protein